MRKGFIHVLEAILVSLLLLVSIPFLLNPGIATENWENVRLKYFGEDVLTVLDNIDSDSPKDGESDLQDIMEFNTFRIDETIFLISKRSGVGYNLRTDGALKKEIRIGCACTNDEVFELQQRLNLANVNDRVSVFRVFAFNYDSLGSLDFDVILVNGEDQLSLLENYYDESQLNKDRITEHLERGRGIVEFVELDNPDTDLQNDIFGLTSGGSGSGDVTFVNTNEPSGQNYYPQKYFYGSGISLNFTSGGTNPIILRGLVHNSRVNFNGDDIETISIDINRNGVFEPGETFDNGNQFTINFGGTSLDYSIDEIDNARGFVYINMERSTPYQFTSFSSSAVDPDVGTDRIIAQGGGRNAAILNEVENGRTVWLAEDSSHDVTALLRASILWAADEEWNNIVRTVSSTQSGVSYVVSQGEEFYEPYIVHMTLWNLF